MTKKEVSMHYREIDDISLLPANEQQLVVHAREMCDQAYAPYSDFYVGSAILLDNGTVVKGSNQENAAYPSGLCAERVAAFAASSNYPETGIKAIAISARSNQVGGDRSISPCGACRQVLLEYELSQGNPIKILLSKEKGAVIIIEKAADLLPLSFSGSDIKKSMCRG